MVVYTMTDSGDSDTRPSSVDLNSLDMPCSLVHLPTVASLCFTVSTSSLSEPSTAPAFPYCPPSNIDVIGLGDNICLPTATSSPRGHGTGQPPTIIGAPTAPRLRSMKTESLSIKKWIDSLSTPDLLCDRICYDRHTPEPPKEWIPEGSLHPPDQYANTLAAARNKAYQRVLSDYSSTTTACPKPSFLIKPSASRIPMVPKQSIATERERTFICRPPAATKPKVVEISSTSSCESPKRPTPRNVVPLARRQIKPPSPREAPKVPTPSQRRENIIQAPEIHKNCLQYREQRQSIATEDMITSLRSQCATLGRNGGQSSSAAKRSGIPTSRGVVQRKGVQQMWKESSHCPKDLSKHRRSVSENDWTFPPSAKAKFGSKLSTACPRIPVSATKPPTRNATQRFTYRHGHMRTRSMHRGSCDCRSTSCSSDELIWSIKPQDRRVRRIVGQVEASKGSVVLKAKSSHRKHEQPIRTPQSALVKVSRLKARSSRKKKAVRFAALPIVINRWSWSSQVWNDDGTETVTSTRSTDSQQEDPYGEQTPSPSPSHCSCADTQNRRLDSTPRFEQYSPWVDCSPGQAASPRTPTSPRIVTRIVPPTLEKNSSPPEPEPSFPRSVSQPTHAHFLKRTFSRRSLSRIILKSAPSFRSDAESRPSSVVIEANGEEEARDDTDAKKTVVVEKAQKGLATSRIPLPLRGIFKRLRG